MRVLQLAVDSGHGGGVERFIMQLTQRLFEEGHETQVLGWRQVSKTPDVHSSAWVFPGHSVDHWIDTARAFEPDVCLWHVGAETAGVASHLAGIVPVFATVHGAICPSGARLFRDHDEVCERRSGFGCGPRWYGRQCGTNRNPMSMLLALKIHNVVIRSLLQCDRVYAVSDAVSRFLQIEGVPVGKITVFDNTLGQLAVAPDPPPNVSRPDGAPLRLLFVGRLVYEKGVQYLLEAMSTLTASAFSVHLTVVGDGWYRPELERKTQTLNLTDRVQFVGGRSFDEVDDFYRAAHLVVAPSIWPDPAPLVVPEARLMGRPVLISDVGGLPEWADILTDVYVARAANAQSLAHAIRVFSEGQRPDQPRTATPRERKRVDLVENVTSWLRERVRSSSEVSRISL